MKTPPEKTARKQAAAKNRGQWQAGVSGNPAGRRPGTGEVAKLRASIATHVPAIVKALVARALDGDPQAARLLLERAVPALKPVDLGIAVSVPGDSLTEKGAAIFAAVANGTITAEQGRALLAALDTLARLREGDEFERRLRALEGGTDAD